MRLLHLVPLVLAVVVCAGSVQSKAQIASPRSVLIDVVNAGGLWWSPQVPPFDPDLPHQGKPLYEFLRTSGFDVTLHREGPIPAELLARHDEVHRVYRRAVSVS
jgi:hypothetical protein